MLDVTHQNGSAGRVLLSAMLACNNPIGVGVVVRRGHGSGRVTCGDLSLRKHQKCIVTLASADEAPSVREERNNGEVPVGGLVTWASTQNSAEC